MTENDEQNRSPGEAVLHALAASFFAAIVAILVLVLPIGANAVGQVVAMAAFVVTVAIALIVSPIMIALARGAGHLTYFWAHLVAGATAGVLLGGVLIPLEKYYSYPITVPIVASLGAWLYVILFHPGKNRWLGEGPRAAGRKGAIAVLGLASLIAVPFVPPVADPFASTSCFNVFRGGKTSARPALMLDVHITDTSDPDVHAFYQAFAARHDLEIAGHPIAGAEAAQADMCNEQVLIKAGGVFPDRDPSHSISVFDLDDNDDWRPLTERLICAVENRWPGASRSTHSRPEQQAYITEIIESRCGQSADETA